MGLKEQIIIALRAFIAQRAGLQFCNYGDVKAYRQEQRSITRDRHDAETLISNVAWRDSITAEHIIEASKHAYSGRLTIAVTEPAAHATFSEGAAREPRKVRIEYCTGQYFPTEYRKAVAAVCASALWDYARANMPKPEGKIACRGFDTDSYDGLSAGDWLRRYFKRELGACIQKRWFS